MFILNFKINGKKTFKFIFILIILLLIILLFSIVLKILSGSQAANSNEKCMPQNKIFDISPQNYTNVLKAVHNNIDDYIGIKIKFTGYVYRLYDFRDNQFVLARDMIVSSDNQTIVVGFLCDYDKIKDFDDYTWVEITGLITKGNYHGDMPIIKVTRN